jgi:hypothetical protein
MLAMLKPFAFLGFSAAGTTGYLLGRFHAAGYRLYSPTEPSITPALAAVLARADRGDLTEADETPDVRRAERQGLISAGGGWSVAYSLTRKGRRALGHHA